MASGSRRLLSEFARFQCNFETSLVADALVDPIREAVFSPNPMWYRPIWSCDFRCNLHGIQSGESLSLAFSSAAYTSVSRWT